MGYTGLFVQAVYGEKAGKIASLSLAFLPFPVLYSCFAYKEQLVMLLTTLTVDKDSAAYIATFGHDGYVELSKRLMVNDASDDLMSRVVALDL